MVKYIILIISLLISPGVFSQNPGLISEGRIESNYADYENEQIESLTRLYYTNIDPSWELINGRGYFRYYHRSASKPILFDEKDHSASVTLKGKKYEDINLDFDSFTDEVIYIDSTRICIYSPLIVAMNKEFVDSFEFYEGNDTITFRYFSNDSDPSFNLTDGYYEVVKEEGSKYLIKHLSYLKKLPGIDEYIYLREGYVNVGNGFSKISKKQFIKIFGNRSREFQRFIVEEGIKIRKANKQQILCVLKYYDTIKK